MHGIVSGVHVSNLPDLIGLFGLWIILFEGTHLLLSLSRNEPLIGWAVGPLGFTPLYLRYPLWGEARILRNIQSLRSSWATIHFTPFGSSYLREQFGSSPTDLLRLL